MTVAVIATATNATAPIRARSLESTPRLSVAAAREHAGVAGLIAGAGGEEAAALLAALFSRGRALRVGKSPCASIGRHDGGEVGELLRLERENLVAGLHRLQRPGRALALADQRRHLRPVGVEIADHTGLDPHRVLQAADRVLPPCPGVGDELLVGRGQRGITVGRLKRLVDLLNVEGDVVRLPEKLLGTLDGLLPAL